MNILITCICKEKCNFAVVVVVVVVVTNKQPIIIIINKQTSIIIHLWTYLFLVVPFFQKHYAPCQTTYFF